MVTQQKNLNKGDQLKVRQLTKGKYNNSVHFSKDIPFRARQKYSCHTFQGWLFWNIFGFSSANWINLFIYHALK